MYLHVPVALVHVDKGRTGLPDSLVKIKIAYT